MGWLNRLILRVWEGRTRARDRRGRTSEGYVSSPLPSIEGPQLVTIAPWAKPLLPSLVSPFPLLHRILGFPHFAHNLTPSPLQQSYHIWARQLGCRTEAEMEPGQVRSNPECVVLWGGFLPREGRVPWLHCPTKSELLLFSITRGRLQTYQVQRVKKPDQELQIILSVQNSRKQGYTEGGARIF